MHIGRGQVVLLVLSTLMAGCDSDNPAAPDEDPPEYLYPCAADPLQLAVAGVSLLPAADSTCVRLDSIPGRYSLVFVDVRPQRQAREEVEANLRQEPPARFGLRVGGTSTAGASSARVASDGARDFGLRKASEQRVHQSVVAPIDCGVSGGLFCLDGPWAEGDSVEVTTLHDDNTRFVVWLTEGPFAFASAPGLADHYVRHWQADLREMVRRTQEPLLDLLDGSFAGPRPVTLNSGQIVYFVRPPQTGTSSTVAVHVPEDSPVRFYVIYELPLMQSDRPSPTALARALEIFVHEPVHAWQWAHLRHHRPFGGLSKYAWGNEGGAQFLTEEIMRQDLGLALDAQLDLDLADDFDGLQGYLLRRVLSGEGLLLDGYDHITPFFRHLLHEGLGAGAGYDDAMAAILAGSIEGWYGTMSEVGAYPGLQERMTALLGRPWNPETGLLEWIAAHAADDRTSAQHLQVPFLFQAWWETPLNRWSALRTLSLVPGQESSFELAPGAAAYANLLSEGGESLHLWSQAPGVHRWALVRWE